MGNSESSLDSSDRHDRTFFLNFHFAMSHHRHPRSPGRSEMIDDAAIAAAMQEDDHDEFVIEIRKKMEARIPEDKPSSSDVDLDRGELPAPHN